MKPRTKDPLESIKKVFRKENIAREKYDPFVDELNKYLKSINERESEEYNKKLIIDFLQNTFYQDRMHTKNQIDLAIYSKSKKYTKKFINCCPVERRLIASLRSAGFITGQFIISMVYKSFKEI